MAKSETVSKSETAVSPAKEAANLMRTAAALAIAGPAKVKSGKNPHKPGSPDWTLYRLNAQSARTQAKVDHAARVGDMLASVGSLLDANPAESVRWSVTVDGVTRSIRSLHTDWTGNGSLSVEQVIAFAAKIPTGN